MSCILAFVLHYKWACMFNLKVIFFHYFSTSKSSLTFTFTASRIVWQFLVRQIYYIEISSNEYLNLISFGWLVNYIAWLSTLKSSKSYFLENCWIVKSYTQKLEAGLKLVRKTIGRFRGDNCLLCTNSFSNCRVFFATDRIKGHSFRVLLLRS